MEILLIDNYDSNRLVLQVISFFHLDQTGTHGSSNVIRGQTGGFS